MATDNNIKEQVLADIRTHLSTVGSRDWKPLLDRWKDVVKEPTMWRWIREARDGEKTAPQLANAKAAITRKLKGVKVDRDEDAKANGTVEIAKHIPAAPSPAYIAENGMAGLQKLDIAIEIQRLYADAMKLRDFAVAIRRDPSGAEREVIKNPVVFEKQIIRRTNLLETALRAVQEVWDLRMMQEFYEAVIDEIGKADPATQRRIMERLSELNSRTGMTMALRV